MTKDRDAMIERAKTYVSKVADGTPDEMMLYAAIACAFAIEIRDEALKAERERIVAGLETLRPDGDNVWTGNYYDGQTTNLTTDDLKALAADHLRADEMRWIPVSERLPVQEGWYLVTFEDDDGVFVLPAEMQFNSDHAPEFITPYCLRMNADADAWMPLPPPYQVDET